MAREVVWLPAAWKDLEAAAEYIAKDSALRAASWVGEIREAARSLVLLALRGRLVPETRRQDLRELIVGNYRLIYAIEPRRVVVVMLVHGARDLWALWREGRPVRRVARFRR